MAITTLKWEGRVVYPSLEFEALILVQEERPGLGVEKPEFSYCFVITS